MEFEIVDMFMLIITIIFGLIAWYIKRTVERIEEIPLLIQSLEELKIDFKEFKTEVWNEIKGIRTEIKEFFKSESYKQG